MLDYVRKNLSGYDFLYQAHPNETDEYKSLDLSGFTMGERAIAELFLFDNRDRIAFVFSALSGASISAAAMGFPSAIFIDTLHEAVPEEAIIGWKSYFAGLSNSFFIKSFDQALPKSQGVSEADEAFALSRIKTAVGDSKKVYVLAPSPDRALYGAIILNMLRKENPNLKAALIMIPHKRWNLIKNYQKIFSVFDEKILLPNDRVLYSARPKKVIAAIKSAQNIKKFKFSEGSALISLSHMVYEEDCFFSYHREIKKILFVENRWYHFIYEEKGLIFPEKDFVVQPGVRFFNWVLAPLLGLYGTIFKEFKDGKVINLARYKKPLEEIFDAVFVIMPGKK